MNRFWTYSLTLFLSLILLGEVARAEYSERSRRKRRAQAEEPVYAQEYEDNEGVQQEYPHDEEAVEQPVNDEAEVEAEAVDEEVDVATEGGFKKKTPPIQVNLDQLVEKVRERLLSDTDLKTVQLKQKLRQNRLTAQQHQQEEAGLKTKVGGQPGMQLGSKRQKNMKFKSGKIMEDHDLYEKTALNQKKGPDSYEDYVTPKKDPEPLESVEEAQKEEKITKKTIKRLKVAARLSTSTASTRKKRLVRVHKMKTPYVPPEYDDDTSPPTAPPLKVRTENIGEVDYKDLSAESKARLDAELNAQYKADKAAKKVAKIVTNMQTRLKFSFSSPNYYAKLPRIAEKYNFDEPIPEKDREEEIMKEVSYGEEILVNKKVQLHGRGATTKRMKKEHLKTVGAQKGQTTFNI